MIHPARQKSSQQDIICENRAPVADTYIGAIGIGFDYSWLRPATPMPLILSCWMFNLKMELLHIHWSPWEKTPILPCYCDLMVSCRNQWVPDCCGSKPDTQMAKLSPIYRESHGTIRR